MIFSHNAIQPGDAQNYLLTNETDENYLKPLWGFIREALSAFKNIQFEIDSTYFRSGRYPSWQSK